MIILALTVGCNDPAVQPEPATSKPNPSFADRLRTLPGVANVEVVVPAINPKLRIIHLLDRHYVTRDLYAADLRDEDPNLTDEAIDNFYAEFLDEVDRLQQKQMEFLRGMVREFDTISVFKEGLTDMEMDAWELEIAKLRTFDRHEVAAVIAGADEILQGAEPGSERYIDASNIKAVAADLLAKHRRDLLRVGAPGRLLITGELDAVLPADDDALLANANPQKDDGRYDWDAVRIEPREDAIVKRLLNERGIAVVVLGQAHDLADNLKRLENGGVELVTVRAKGLNPAR